MRRRIFVAGVAAAALVGLFVIPAEDNPAVAAEIKVMASDGVRGAVTELAPQFERATGHKVVVDFDFFVVLKRRIDAGETFDITILSPALIDELIQAGKVAAGTRTNIARTGLGVAVRKGSPKPDIGSVDAVRRTLLGAKSVGYLKEGASGKNFLIALERLGIGSEMKPKLKPHDSKSIGPAFESGEVELYVAGAGAVLNTPGTDFLGTLPSDLQTYVSFAAGVSAGTSNPDAAGALVRHLTSPAAALVLKAKGLEPN